MQVKDLILYQVATDRNYKVGDQLHFGDQPNGQMKIFDAAFNKNGTPLHWLTLQHAKKRGFWKNKALLFDTYDALANYDLFMREIALEEVRKEKFPFLPSRFRCMYLSDTGDIAKKNMDIMKQRAPQKQYQAISVKLCGEVFYVKDFGIGRSGLSFNEYKELAEKFWSQDQTSKKESKEILFVGDAEVVEILKEYKKEEK